MARRVPEGSPSQAAGEKPWKAGTENQQMPFSHELWFDRLGKVGSSLKGAGKKQPRAKGGSVTAGSAGVPQSVIPIKEPSPSLQNAALAAVLVMGRWGWNELTAQLSLSAVFRGRWGRSPASEHPVL